MDRAIQPLNVAGAALLMQVLFLVIVAATSYMYKTAPPSAVFPRHEHVSAAARRFLWILSVSLASIAVILVSDQFSVIWEPLFNGATIDTLSMVWSLNTMFVLDLLLIGYLVKGSGGSQRSPFSAALFTIPSLGIFLRTPPASFMSYAAISGAIYVLLLFGTSDDLVIDDMLHSQQTHLGKRAAAFMTIACLLLAMLTGYITRPIPVRGLDNSAGAVHHGPGPAPAH